MDEHPLVETGEPVSLAEHCLQLMHQKAYDVAADCAHDKDVLDLGCNVGYGTSMLAGTARSVAGVDVSAQLVAHARARYPALSFQTYDGTALPFKAGTFDLVVSCQVIEHVEDTTRFLSEVRRVLRTGGAAIFTTPNAATRLDPGMKPWNRHHVREFTAPELRSVCSAIFSPVDVRGLYAVPELHRVELDRCARMREIARWRDGHWSPVRSVRAAKAAVMGIALRLVPSRWLDLIRGALPRPKPTQFQRYTVAALRYSTESGAEGAIDLMAICRV